ncbi:MAG: hypothetical protein ABIH46_12350 [Chloroflexota bacterium]
MKKLIFMAITGVLLLSFSLPSAAVASSERDEERGERRASAFTAGGTVWVAGLPVPTEIKERGRGVRILTEGEPVVGVVSQSSWALLQGGAFSTTHKSTVTYLPNKKFRGELKGDFSIATPQGTLTGKMKGEVNGTFTWADANSNGEVDAPEAGSIFIQTISDVGTWEATSGTGTFRRVDAEGSWKANLNWSDALGTLIGPISLRGVHE